MFELNQDKDREAPDGLFLERLEAFMDKSLQDVKAFSERELRPFEETRRYVAEWHSRHLFQRHDGAVASDRDARVRSLLCDASRILESLFGLSGIQSFLLAVDPGDSADEGFLGGTVLGREFWRGLRNGGDVGAKAFRFHCLKVTETTATSSGAGDPLTTQAATVTLKRGPANSIKTELYAGVRKALRSVSGIRNAEMKWTNHERLNTYGVRIIGWPSGIPAQNPSTLNSSQNKLLLESLENGTMRFVRIATATGSNDDSEPRTNSPSNGVAEEVDLSWAYHEDGPSPPNGNSQNPSGLSSIRKQNHFRSWDDIHHDDDPKNNPISSALSPGQESHLTRQVISTASLNEAHDLDMSAIDWNAIQGPRKRSRGEQADDA